MSSVTREENNISTAKPKKRGILYSHNPHHTPGYGGFCPQFKFQIGHTFGRATNRLLTNPNVASSGCLVLTDIYLPPLNKRGSLIPDYSAQKRVIRNRTNRWGNEKLVENMVPGYTGFIPKSEHHFSNRYAVNCTSAISEFDADCRGLTHRRAEMDKHSQNPKEGLSAEEKKKYQVPLIPIAEKAKPFISQNKTHHSRSPLYMDNDNPNKNFMSGYTGFVPRVRGQIGSCYPSITNRALNEFTDDLANQAFVANLPIVIYRPEEQVLNPVSLYPIDSGLVPNYTGHIPGQKFRNGGTFGHTTKNSLNLKA